MSTHAHQWKTGGGRNPSGKHLLATTFSFWTSWVAGLDNYLSCTFSFCFLGLIMNQVKHVYGWRRQCLLSSRLPDWVRYLRRSPATVDELKIEKTLLLARRSFSKYLILQSVCGEPLHGEHRSLHEKFICALFRFFMCCKKGLVKNDVHLRDFVLTVLRKKCTFRKWSLPALLVYPTQGHVSCLRWSLLELRN